MAIGRDSDWVTLLRECRENPTKGNIHTVLSSGEVLAFSNPLALTYEYPYILGKEQNRLHTHLVYSSLYSIPLIPPVKSGGLRIHTGQEQTKQALAHGVQHVGYVADEGTGGNCSNTDEVPNHWKPIMSVSMMNVSWWVLPGSILSVKMST